MPGAADSLNVAVAAGIVLFAAARVRSAPRTIRA
jgi:tRNA G18 (ribose-2'-O)-methylase SpoU